MSPEEIHFPDHHGGDEDAGAGAADRTLAWGLDHVELLTVGVDIGSSTSHLMFSRLHLERQAQSLSSRFVVARREALHRSPVGFTPFAARNRIDVAALRTFVDASYREAGLAPDDVDTGAVILTGVALQRRNARAVAELFAEAGGRFVCAAAGESLEAILSAHGAGAVALSRSRPGRRIHADLGGGSGKLALLEAGEVLETAAVPVGARRLPAGAERGAAALVAAMAAWQARKGTAVTCSGGVSEYIYGRESRRFDDQGPELAAAFTAACRSHGFDLQPLPGEEGIRATAVGASQFSVQLSGSTVYISNPDRLPLRNLPVVRLRLPAGELDAGAVAGAIRSALRRLDLKDGRGPVAVALAWSGEPRHRSLRALAGGLAAGLRASLARGLPLVMALDADLGRSLGWMLAEELDVRADLVCIDGLELAELDYVDIGAPLLPANVVPVLVKSLAFEVTN